MAERWDQRDEQEPNVTEAWRVGKASRWVMWSDTHLAKVTLATVWRMNWRARVKRALFMFKLGGETTKHIALLVLSTDGACKSLDNELPGRTENSWWCYLWSGGWKWERWCWFIRKLSFIHHILLLEIKAGNKYDKILTVANSGKRVKIELLFCSLEMSQSFHFLKRKVKNGER